MRAYVGTFGGGLRVVDVSDPTSPVDLGGAPDAFRVTAVDVVEGVVCAAASSHGLHLLDVEDPAAIVELARVPPPFPGNSSTVGVAVAGPLAYTANTQSGVQVFDVSVPSRPIALGGFSTPGSANDIAFGRGLVHVADRRHGLQILDFGPEFPFPERPPRTVEVDIRPHSPRNVINPLSRGFVSVAIRGSDTFDVAVVDPTTLAFGPDGASPLHRGDRYFRDVSPDGFANLVSHYRTEESGITVGETQACVTGELLDGTPFEGCDDITTEPPCGDGFELALLLPPFVWLHRRRRLAAS
jgi:hypothetical protein